MRITTQRIQKVLGAADRPKQVSQEQFDDFQDMLVQIAKTRWDKIPEDLLWAYIHDLSYMTLQPDLFRHAFPACLKFWYDSLMRDEDAARGDADFHYALVHGEILTKMLSTVERERVYDFFVDGYLDRVDQQRGFASSCRDKSAHAWIGRFNSLGLVAPVIEKICSSWWSLKTQEQSLCAVMYFSGLVYLRGENPLYLPWTREDGGGDPYLVESDASIFDSAWLSENLDYLKETLTPDFVLDRLGAAALTLENEIEGEQAVKISEYAATQKDLISVRIEDLLEDLARNEFAKKHKWEW